MEEFEANQIIYLSIYEMKINVIVFLFQKFNQCFHSLITHKINYYHKPYLQYQVTWIKHALPNILVLKTNKKMLKRKFTHIFVYNAIKGIFTF